MYTKRDICWNPWYIILRRVIFCVPLLVSFAFFIFCMFLMYGYDEAKTFAKELW